MQIGDILLVGDAPEQVESTLETLEEIHLANPIRIARTHVQARDVVFCSGDYEQPEDCTPPALVLLDGKFVHDEGVELLREIRSDERTRTLPVLVMVSSGEERAQMEQASLGVNGYIWKPIQRGQFAQAINKIGLGWVLQRAPA